jgi:hypothetical protein
MTTLPSLRAERSNPVMPPVMKKRNTYFLTTPMKTKHSVSKHITSTGTPDQSGAFKKKESAHFCVIIDFSLLLCRLNSNIINNIIYNTQKI